MPDEFEKAPVEQRVQTVDASPLAEDPGEQSEHCVRPVEPAIEPALQAIQVEAPAAE